ncbi:outer membrane protein assembly factor BamB family protein [Deinococcus roseus]|uniref:VWFD domain-containing protein n=1 Tax=Deinococcus roseus TaxID=392414 RepID=A0ABQ2D716_9DEIO|nr:PQQ-binding-like beta-propeller repeat protein [Deinococcus roseus]GGJ48284.1 hypothetical protein GCM10008938_37880 [Deinococcus roseus]
MTDIPPLTSKVYAIAMRNVPFQGFNIKLKDAAPYIKYKVYRSVSTTKYTCNGIADGDADGLDFREFGSDPKTSTLLVLVSNTSIKDKQSAKIEIKSLPLPETARAYGDPHLRTFDGRRYDAHQLGEFTYLTPLTGNGLTIQARQVLSNPTRFPAEIRATVASADGVKVEVGPQGYLLNGVPFTENHIQLGNISITVNRSYAVVQMNTPYGDVELSGDDVFVRNLAAGIPYGGLLGTPNGDPTDDFTTSTGALTSDVLAFQDSWRVTTHAQSLFTYRAGEGPSTYNKTNPFLQNTIPAAEFQPFQDRARQLLTGYCLSTSAVEQDVIDATALDLYVGTPESEVVFNTCNYQVTGTILNTLMDNAPVAGASVQVTSGTLSSCMATTDQNGRYGCTLSPSTPSSTAPSVQVSVQGIPVTSGTFPSQAAQGSNLEMTLDAQVPITTLKLSGNVVLTEPAGQPAAGASVQLQTDTGKWGTTTDAAGHYQLTVPVPAAAPSPWPVTFEVKKDNLITHTPVDLPFTPQSITERTVDLELSKFVGFTASITHPARTDVLLPGALTIRNSSNTVLCSSDTSQCVTELKVTENQQATATVSGDWGSATQNFTLIPGQYNYTLQFPVNVTLFGLQGQIKDVTQTALPDVMVSAVSNWWITTTPRTTTDAQGNYQLWGYQRPGSTVGPVTLSAVYGLQEGAKQIPLNPSQVPAGQVTNLQHNLQISHTVMVTGQVTLDRQPSDVKIGDPAGNVQVISNNTVLCNARVDLASQTYTCMITLTDTTAVPFTLQYSGSFGSGSMVLPMPGWSNTGTTTLTQNLTLKGNRVELQGIVRSAQGAPMPNTPVKFSGAFTATRTTDANGKYSVIAITENTQPLSVTLKVSNGLNVESRTLSLSVQPQALTTHTQDVQFTDVAAGRVRWSLPLGGGVYAGLAALSDDTLIVAVRTSSGSKLLAIKSDKEQLWSLALPASDVLGTPAVDAQDNLYFGNQNGQVFKVDKSGALQWTFPTGDTIYAPVVLANNLVMVASADGKVYALHPDGTVLWTHQTGSTVRLPVVWNGTSFFVAPEDNSILEISAQGQPIKTYPLGAQVAGTLSVTAEGHVLFFTSNQQEHHILQDHTLHSRPISGSRASPASPVALGSNGQQAYVDFEGSFTHFNPITGAKWQQAGEASSLSPVFTATGVDFSSGNSIQNFNSEGSLNWTFTAQSGISSHPILLGSGLYATDQLGTLYAVNTSSPADPTWNRLGGTGSNNAWQTQRSGGLYEYLFTGPIKIGTADLTLNNMLVSVLRDNQVVCQVQSDAAGNFECPVFLPSNTDVKVQVESGWFSKVEKQVHLSNTPQFSQTLNLEGLMREVTVQVQLATADPDLIMGVQVDDIESGRCTQVDPLHFNCLLYVADGLAHTLKVKYYGYGITLEQDIQLDASWNPQTVLQTSLNNRYPIYSGEFIWNPGYWNDYHTTSIEMTIKDENRDICTITVGWGRYKCYDLQGSPTGVLTYVLSRQGVPYDHFRLETTRPQQAGDQQVQDIQLYSGGIQSRLVNANGRVLSLSLKVLDTSGNDLCTPLIQNGGYSCNITAWTPELPGIQLWAGQTAGQADHLVGALPAGIPGNGFLEDTLVDVPVVTILVNVPENSVLQNIQLAFNGVPMDVPYRLSAEGLTFDVLNFTGLQGTFTVDYDEWGEHSTWVTDPLSVHANDSLVASAHP